MPFAGWRPPARWLWVGGRLLAARWQAAGIYGGFALFVGLLCALALSTTPSGALRWTVSSYALGPYGELARLALICLGVGSFAVSARLTTGCAGGAHKVLAALPCVWATGAVVDAFVNADPGRVRTVHGAFHIGVAITACVVLLVATVLLSWIMRGRGGGTAVACWSAGALVWASALWVAITPVGLSGLSERVLFAAAIYWMLVAVRVLDRATGELTGRPGQSRGSEQRRGALHELDHDAVRVGHETDAQRVETCAG